MEKVQTFNGQLQNCPAQASKQKVVKIDRGGNITVSTSPVKGCKFSSILVSCHNKSCLSSKLKNFRLLQIDSISDKLEYMITVKEQLAKMKRNNSKLIFVRIVPLFLI